METTLKHIREEIGQMSQAKRDGELQTYASDNAEYLLELLENVEFHLRQKGEERVGESEAA